MKLCFFVAIFAIASTASVFATVTSIIPQPKILTCDATLSSVIRLTWCMKTETFNVSLVKKCPSKCRHGKCVHDNVSTPIPSTDTLTVWVAELTKPDPVQGYQFAFVFRAFIQGQSSFSPCDTSVLLSCNNGTTYRTGMSEISTDTSPHNIYPFLFDSTFNYTQSWPTLFCSNSSRTPDFDSYIQYGDFNVSFERPYNQFKDGKVDFLPAGEGWTDLAGAWVYSKPILNRTAQIHS